MSNPTPTPTERKIAHVARPKAYTPQPGNKAVLSLADFSDESLFGELRRRGWSGELCHMKVVAV